jgi:hypothetical protein
MSSGDDVWCGSSSAQRVLPPILKRTPDGETPNDKRRPVAGDVFFEIFVIVTDWLQMLPSSSAPSTWSIPSPHRVQISFQREKEREISLDLENL